MPKATSTDLKRSASAMMVALATVAAAPMALSGCDASKTDDGSESSRTPATNPCAPGNPCAPAKKKPSNPCAPG